MVCTGLLYRSCGQVVRPADSAFIQFQPPHKTSKDSSPSNPPYLSTVPNVPGMIWNQEQTMPKVTIRYTDHLAQTIQRMREDGLLLVTSGAHGKLNVMTIGWGTLGVMWGRPVFLVLVRPSRHTYSLLEEVGEFTVNVPPRELAARVNLCGTVSGRDHDKFQEARLTPVASRQVRPPIIQECVVHYECRVLHRNDVELGALVQAILDDAYPQGDFHRVYFGEIVAAYADQDAAQCLSEAAGVLPVARP